MSSEGYEHGDTVWYAPHQAIRFAAIVVSDTGDTVSLLPHDSYWAWRGTRLVRSGREVLATRDRVAHRSDEVAGWDDARATIAGCERDPARCTYPLCDCAEPRRRRREGALY